MTSLPDGMPEWVEGTDVETGVTDRLFSAWVIYGQMTCPDCGRTLAYSRGGHSGKEMKTITEGGVSRPYDHPLMPRV